MSPDEVVRRLTAGNTISPSGNIRIGKMMPIVPINALVVKPAELGNIADPAGRVPARCGPPRSVREKP